MRKSYVWLMVAVLSCLSAGYADTRIFTDKDGRSIEAELVRYNDSKMLVTIKRAGSRREMNVPITIFSAADQKYIEMWGSTQDFQDRKLQADIRRMKKIVDSKATTASTQVKTRHWFKVVFENNTKTSFNDLEIEYVMYYEQEHHIRSGQDVEMKRGSLYHKDKVSLPAGKTTEFEMKPVTLYTWKTYSLKPVDSEMVGARVRLTYTPESGKPEVKEFSYPEGLREMWKTDTTDAQVKRNF